MPPTPRRRRWPWRARNAGHLGIANVEFRLGASGSHRLAGRHARCSTVSNPLTSRWPIRTWPRATCASSRAQRWSQATTVWTPSAEIAAQALARLRPGGWLLLEHGHDQSAAVREVLAGDTDSPISPAIAISPDGTV
ncbi:MAG: hypothetical protein MZV65_52545 [Chromatiales bacterium]|nr:hypothetical protein [Chromatiales bacterium]